MALEPEFIGHYFGKPRIRLDFVLHLSKTLHSVYKFSCNRSNYDLMQQVFGVEYKLEDNEALKLCTYITPRGYEPNLHDWDL